MCVSVCLCVSLCVSVCLCVSLCVSVCLCVSLCVSVCLCVSLCVSVCLWFSLCVSVRLCASLCVSVRLCASLCVSVRLCASGCVSVRLCASLCVSRLGVIFRGTFGSGEGGVLHMQMDATVLAMPFALPTNIGEPWPCHCGAPAVLSVPLSPPTRILLQPLRKLKGRYVKLVGSCVAQVVCMSRSPWS